MAVTTSDNTYTRPQQCFQPSGAFYFRSFYVLHRYLFPFSHQHQEDLKKKKKEICKISYIISLVLDLKKLKWCFSFMRILLFKENSVYLYALYRFPSWRKKWSMLLLPFSKFISPLLLHIIILHLIPSQKLDCWLHFSFGKNSMWFYVGCLSVRNSSVDVLVSRRKTYREIYTFRGRANVGD